MMWVYGLGYFLAGLFTARQMGFYVYKKKKQHNEARGLLGDPWDQPGMFFKPLFSGLLWPLVVPAVAVVLLTVGVGKVVYPALEWFFTMPEYRKQKALNK